MLNFAYCSKECQVSHWKSKHKKDCKRLQIEGGLVPKKLGKDEHFMGIASKEYSDRFCRYDPPDVLKETGESFWIKVRTTNRGVRMLDTELVINDKILTCIFMLLPGENGHRELVEKLSQEQTFLGQRSLFEAKFDAEKGRIVWFTLTLRPHIEVVIHFFLLL